MVLDEIGMLQGPTNAALDNTWFGLLLKRPRWYSGSTYPQRKRVTQLFAKIMSGQLWLTPEEVGVVISAVWERLLHPYNHKADLEENSEVAARFFAHYLGLANDGNERPVRGDGRWAFKEPNSYLFLEELDDVYPGYRYIHTVRSGLDMAFSSNQNQVLNWGDHFGVSTTDLDALTPEQSLEFWNRANEFAITTGDRLLGDRFLTIAFEDLCLRAPEVMEIIFDFLEMPLSSQRRDELAAIPRLPDTHGRHLDQNVEMFPDALLQREAALMDAVRSRLDLPAHGSSNTSTSTA